MRKLKALLAIGVLAMGVGSVSHTSLQYGYLLSYAGASAGWGLAFSVGAVIGCGLAAAG